MAAAIDMTTALTPYISPLLNRTLTAVFAIAISNLAQPVKAAIFQAGIRRPGGSIRRQDRIDPQMGGRQGRMPAVMDATPPSRRTLRGLLLGGLVLLALVPAALWWVGHQATLSVSAATGIPHCEGTEVTTVDEPESNLEEAAIPMTDGFVCTLTIKVMNHGDRAVTLSQAEFPVAGPGAASSFQATHIGGVAVVADDHVDAVSDIASSLEPGAEQLLDLRVTFRESGCTSEGAFQWVAPTIEVQNLLASHDLTIADLPRFLGTADSSCDT